MTTFDVYAAGFFDGEGYVGVSKARTSYSLRVSVANTNYAVLALFAEEYGCRVYFSTKSADEWIATGTKAYEFLKRIEPYVIVKKNQVRLAIKAYENKTLADAITPLREMKKVIHENVD